MGDDSAETGTEGMRGESLDIRPGQRLGKPLHVVLHKDLDRRASDTDTPINGSGDSADGRDMRTEQGEDVG